MSYRAAVSVEFPRPRQVVYDALCDLGRYPEWNAGMTHISNHGRMHPGLTYSTTSEVLGKTNQSRIKVLDMVPDRTIVLQSVTGLISFLATFDVEDVAPDTSSVTCGLQLEFSKALFNLAQPIAEAIAENHIRHALEILRDRLANTTNANPG